MRGTGRLYTVEFHGVAATAQQDLFYLKPAADKPIFVEAVVITAGGVAADAGDAQEELWDLRAIRVPATVTAGSSGNSFTPTPVNPSDTAAGFTARINDTTVATTSGTLAVIHSDGMNNRSGFSWPPAPEHGHWVFNAGAWVFRLSSTPNDSILLNGTAYVREFG